MTDDHARGLPPERVDEQVDAAEPRRLSEPMILALIGLAVALLLFAATALPVILSRDDDTSDNASDDPSDVSLITIVPEDPDATTSPLAAASDPATSGSSDVNPDPSASAVETVAGSDITETSSELADGGVASSIDPDASNNRAVPESVAVVLGGKIYLEGAVPDEASRAEIVALAAEIFTPDNVIDNYIIDPQASDPNLGNIRVDDTVLFGTDSATIDPAFEPLLNQGLALLTIRPATTFTIEGHTDSRGSDNYNLELSRARARAVVQWFIDRGVSPLRLTAVGKGEREPIASDDTSEGRQQNRRIEVTIENLLTDSG